MWKTAKDDQDLTEPIEVEAADPHWPARDAEGQMIFENTHFLDKERAWSYLIANREAHVSLSCMDVETRRHGLKKAEAELVEATLLLERAKKARKNEPSENESASKQITN
jgi:hypothetical protein